MDNLDIHMIAWLQDNVTQVIIAYIIIKILERKFSNGCQGKEKIASENKRVDSSRRRDLD